MRCSGHNDMYEDKELVNVPYEERFVRTKKHYSNLY